MATQNDDARMSEPVRERIVSAATYGFPSDEREMLTWEQTRAKLASAHNYWLATTRPDGRSHVTPLWGAWIDDTFYFDGLPTAIWARNVASNPSASLHLESGEDVVIVEGDVDDLIIASEMGTRLVDDWMRKYGRLAPNPTTDGVFRLTPSSARAWSTSSLSDGTRWRFRPRRES